MSSPRCLRKLALWSLVPAMWGVPFGPAFLVCASCRFTAFGAAAAAVESGLQTVSQVAGSGLVEGGLQEFGPFDVAASASPYLVGGDVEGSRGSGE